jgi:hypothetical protein
MLLFLAAMGADDIMAKVAVNQDLAESARAAFVYRQKVEVRLRDTHGHLVREEISDYQVMPDAAGTHKDLVKFKGRLQNKGSMVEYAESGDRGDGIRQEVDSELATEMRDELTGEENSKDGIAADLFPLTAKEQRKYRFTLKGEEKYRGADAWRIAFRPKENDKTIWGGEALISKSDFQPLVVTTKTARGVPFWVKTALGTNLQGLGFSVEYQKFDGDVWFPVSYGTEFKVRAVFVYGRNISVSLVNSDFRRADVQTTVQFDTVSAADAKTPPESAPPRP